MTDISNSSPNLSVLRDRFLESTALVNSGATVLKQTNGLQNANKPKQQAISQIKTWNTFQDYRALQSMLWFN